MYLMLDAWLAVPYDRKYSKWDAFVKKMTILEHFTIHKSWP